MLLGGMKHLSPKACDSLLRSLGRPRDILPGIDLTFSDPRPSYDWTREVVNFFGESLWHVVKCAVSREALEDHFEADGQGKEGRFAGYHGNLSIIERMARTKYLSWPVELTETILLTADDVDALGSHGQR
jgi:hypothetical protein